MTQPAHLKFVSLHYNKIAKEIINIVNRVKNISVACVVIQEATLWD